MTIAYYTNVDLKQNPISNFSIENLSSFPASPVVGQWVYLSGTNSYYFWNGSQWISVTSIDTSLSGQSFQNYILNGAFKYWNGSIPAAWILAGALSSFTTVDQVNFSPNINGNMAELIVNANTSIGTVYLSQNINLQGNADPILSIKINNTNTNLQVFLNVTGYSGPNQTGTTQTWNLTENVPVGSIIGLSLPLTGYYGTYESLNVEVGVNATTTGLSNVSFYVGEIAIYSGNILLSYQSNPEDYKLELQYTTNLEGLNIDGNVQLGTASGQTVKTFHNTLDDGTGDVVVAGTSTLNGVTTVAANVQLGTASGQTVKTFHNTLDDGAGDVGIAGAMYLTGPLSATQQFLQSSAHNVYFLSSGTWTVPTGVTTVYVTAAGGGGGGGGSSADIYAGGGGGGGASMFRVPIPVVSGDTITVTIGSGGTGGAAATVGNSGSSTSFVDSTTNDTLFILGGGAGGSGSGVPTSTENLPGTFTNNTTSIIINCSSGGGSFGIYAANGGYSGGGGTGGGTIFGGGGAASQVNGFAALANTGGGGSGAGSYSTSNVGGNGANGFMLIEF